MKRLSPQFYVICFDDFKQKHNFWNVKPKRATQIRYSMITILICTTIRLFARLCLRLAKSEDEEAGWARAAMKSVPVEFP